MDPRLSARVARVTPAPRATDLEPAPSVGPRRTRVLVVLTDLHAGGAQRVVVTLLRHLPRSRFELHLALVRREGAFLAELPGDVPVRALGARRVRGALVPLVRLARELRPDVVFSTLYHLNQFLLLLRPLLPRGTRVVIREAITPSAALASRGGGRALLAGLLFRTVYRSADRIVAQCRFMADDLALRFGVPRARMRVIYNPIDLAAVRAAAGSAPSPFAGSGPGPHVVALGRLAPQKGFDALIASAPRLIERMPGAQLWILGDEPPGSGARAALEAQARALGLAGRVHLPGFQPNPYAFLRNADLFVLCSRYEGLPNALIEALACGCPVIALDRPGGTREILELAGQPQRLVPELDWRPDWLRGAGPAPAPDLSAFELDAVVGAYAAVLAGG